MSTHGIKDRPSSTAHNASKYIDDKEYVQLYKICQTYEQTQQELTNFMCMHLHGKILTGKQFNIFFPPNIYSVKKIIPESQNSRGIELVSRKVITDTQEFDTFIPCSAGGLYSAPSQYATNWTLYKENLTKIANVHFPDTALIFIEAHTNEFGLCNPEYTKLKSSQLILGEITNWFENTDLIKQINTTSLHNWCTLNNYEIINQLQIKHIDIIKYICGRRTGRCTL